MPARDFFSSPRNTFIGFSRFPDNSCGTDAGDNGTTGDFNLPQQLFQVGHCALEGHFRQEGVCEGQGEREEQRRQRGRYDRLHFGR